jgi:hypothetical protein
MFLFRFVASLEGCPRLIYLLSLEERETNNITTKVTLSVDLTKES